MKKTIDLLGIGNAIVDILTYQNTAFLKKHNLVEGVTTLVDLPTSEKIYHDMGTSTDCAGGGAANTISGFSMLGGKASFIGKISDDQLGRIFSRSLERSNVSFLSSPTLETKLPTAKCLIMVTETQQNGVKNIERTMATYLGISGKLSINDLDIDAIKAARIVFFEGYLWDDEGARDALKHVIDISKSNNTKVAFTLSDPFCVQRHKEDFLDLVENETDIIFANEHEIASLYPGKHFNEILYRLSQTSCELASITRGSQGSYIIHKDSIYPIEAELVKNVYDVTGAGDLYASGVIYGYLNGFSPEQCGKLGSLCASETIQFIGARPATPIKGLIEKSTSSC